jgi:glycosyltransferase involved in cell wall biosynthesis
MMGSIDISVVMSVYNTKEEYLRAAVESILNQDFKNFEFIVILDNPTDNSANIINSYAEQDNRIVVIQNETNLGLTKSLNKGLEIAQGKYIARMDADDVSVPWRLRIQKKYLDAHQDVGVVGAHVYTGIKGSRFMTAWSKNSEKTKIKMLFRNAGVPHPTAMYRASIDGEKVYYDEQILKSQDYALWAVLINKTKIVVMNEILLLYRIHKDQISAVSAGQNKFSSITVQRQLKEKFDIEDQGLLNCCSSLTYGGDDLINDAQIQDAFRFLISQNNSKHIYYEPTFKSVLNELLMEFKYVGKVKNGFSSVSALLCLLREYRIISFWNFFKSYFISKMKHDRLSAKFEKHNRDLCKSVCCDMAT